MFIRSIHNNNRKAADDYKIIVCDSSTIVRLPGLALAIAVCLVAVIGYSKVRRKEGRIDLCELPTHVEPLEYDIQLGFTDNYNKVRGEVAILFEFNKKQNPATRFLKSIVPKCFNDGASQINPSITIALNVDKEFIKWNLSSQIP